MARLSRPPRRRRPFSAPSREEDGMARSKRKVKSRSKVKRTGARTKRARSIKRKRRAKRGPR